MAQVKIISPHGWDWERPVVIEIPISSRGLIGNDRSAFLKTASHVFLPYLDNIKIAKDEHPVHILSHGATEFYGPNRNGDGFKAATCRQYHGTFEKYARWYRNHKNKDPNISYGKLLKSAYNEDMHRVELLGVLNKEKSAAERNGGLVADKEMEKLARGEDIPVSMACRVPYDECSWCHNKARTRDEYCKAASCAAGGCTDNLTRLVKMGSDVHQLHVDNPRPTWFDISNVFRPADRIAYSNTADYLLKAASDDFDGAYGVPGWKIAQDLEVMAPMAVIFEQEMLPGQYSEIVEAQVKLAAALDLVESQRGYLHPEYARAFDPALREEVDLTPLGEPGSEKCAEGLAALADRKVILPLKDFARLVKTAELAELAQARLRGVYGRMLVDGSLSQRVANNPYHCVTTKTASLVQRRLAERAYESLSLEKQAVHRRCLRSSIRSPQIPNLKTGFGNEKAAADTPAAEELARQYACYKVAALRRIAGTDPDFPLTAKLGVLQNHVVS